MAEKTFANAREFALFIQRAAKVELFADTAARAQVAIRIVELVKESIGDPLMLPPPLSASTQAERERLGYEADATLLRTGELRNSYKMAHEGVRKTVAGSDSELALIHELGAHGAGRGHATEIPARHPLVAAVRDHQEQLLARYLVTFDALFDPR